MKEFINYDFCIKRIILACFVPAGTGDAIHKNRSSHGLAIHTSGEKEYVFSDGKRLIVKANHIIYLPKNSSYTVISHSPGDCYAINFDIDENKNFAPFVAKVKNHSAIISHFQAANAVWTLKKNAFDLKCMAELYNIIYLLHQEYFSEYYPESKREIIRAAVEYIHENYSNEAISIEGLSALCGITPEYFRKIFRSFYGTSPIKYINGLKIARAKELLKSRMYSVTDAALLSGYTEMSHFCREFKKAVGTSPSEYKKS